MTKGARTAFRRHSLKPGLMYFPSAGSRRNLRSWPGSIGRMRWSSWQASSATTTRVETRAVRLMTEAWIPSITGQPSLKRSFSRSGFSSWMYPRGTTNAIIVTTAPTSDSLNLKPCLITLVRGFVTSPSFSSTMPRVGAEAWTWRLNSVSRSVISRRTKTMSMPTNEQMKQEYQMRKLLGHSAPSMPTVDGRSEPTSTTQDTIGTSTCLYTCFTPGGQLIVNRSQSIFSPGAYDATACAPKMNFSWLMKASARPLAARLKILFRVWPLTRPRKQPAARLRTLPKRFIMRPVSAMRATRRAGTRQIQEMRHAGIKPRIITNNATKIHMFMRIGKGARIATVSGETSETK
mmetsp:Transcript_58210/g.164360  ORF Transcript_58210/g.164360 Transcript_58210/m.164360 type:complete len:348 (-) Transcript_58210:874-1917(-)